MHVSTGFSEFPNVEQLDPSLPQLTDLREKANNKQQQQQTVQMADFCFQLVLYIAKNRRMFQ